MATGIGVDQGKTAFLEEFLPGNRDAGLTEINEAWRASGREGTLSESLISKTRSRLKIPRARAAAGGGVGRSKPKGKAKSMRRAARADATPIAEEAPSRPEGRAGGGPNKTAFIREQLERDGNLDAKAINRAWSEAGQGGDLSDNLIYKTRASMGIKGRRATPAEGDGGAARPESSPKGGEPAAAPEAVPPARSSNGRHASPPAEELTRPSRVGGGHGRALHEIEGEIDELMFRLRGLGEFAEVLEALRTARRLLVRSHGD